MHTTTNQQTRLGHGARKRCGVLVALALIAGLSLVALPGAAAAEPDPVVCTGAEDTCATTGDGTLTFFPLTTCSFVVHIDWGDGESETFNNVPGPAQVRPHTYTAPGTYALTLATIEGSPAGCTGFQAAYLIIVPGYECNGLLATIVGTAGDDTIDGTSGDDVIVGLGGNDVIRGLGGDDHLCGNDGADLLRGGGGKDVLLGGKGADILKGGRSADTLKGDSGHDRLFGNSGADRLVGGTGHDVLKGGSAGDFLSGGKGNDALKGGTGKDRLFGRSGDDSLNGGGGTDKCRGGKGTDTLTECET